MHRIRALTLAVIATACAVHIPLAVAAEPYPSRPVRIVVGTPPGTAGDTTARVVGDALAQRLGQAFVIDNKPGANGAISAAVVAGAPGDGYTLLFSASSALTITPHVVKKLTWNALTSFEPIVEVGTAPLAIFVTRKSGIRTLPELIQAAKNKPGQLNMGMLPLSMSQIAVEMLQSQAGVKFQSVPYKGSVEMATGMLGGELDVGLVGLGGLTTQLTPEGGLRVLGITTQERSPTVADAPAIREIVPNYEAGSWFGLFGPAGMDAALSRKLNEAMNEALKDDKVRQQLLNLGTIPTGGGPDVLKRHFANDYKRFGAVIEKLGVKPE